MVWECHQASKQARQKFNVERFGLKNLNDVKAREQYQVDISNKLAALENVDDNEDINRHWENIRAGYFKHKILNQQMHYYYYYYYYIYVIPVNQSNMFRSLPGIIIRDTCDSMNYIN